MPLAIRIRASLARLPLGRLAALLLGGAVAFFCLAMPGDLLARLLDMSGVPRMLAIAAPPLGAPARALVAFAVGSLSFLAVWGGFALADGARARVSEFQPAEPEAETPSVARPPTLFAMADVHDILELTDPLPPLAPPPLATAPARARPSPDDSIPVLMARLEAGLARRAAHDPPPAPAHPDGWPDGRVRAALDQLHRLARER
jgi:hypothetical protein